MKNQQDKKEEKREKQEKKFRLKTVLIAFSVLILILVVSFLGSFYLTDFDQESWLGRLSQKIAYPAVVVNDQKIIYNHDLQENLKALEHFYENQNFSDVGIRIDFSTADGRKRLKIKEKDILNKLVEDAGIEILAKEKGIEISSLEIDSLIGQQVLENGTDQQVTQNLQDLYGWDLDKFKQRIALPDIYGQKLKEAVMSENEYNKEALGKIEKARAELLEGKDFVQVVRTYSEGQSVDEGGEIGWIAKDQVIPEVAEKIFSEESDTDQLKREIIESELGYHIVEVEESKKENEVDTVRLRQIFVRKESFADWLKTQMQKMNVKVLLPGYVWNNEEALIEFESQDMKVFEKQMYDNIDGDASLFF